MNALKTYNFPYWNETNEPHSLAHNIVTRANIVILWLMIYKLSAAFILFLF